MRFGCSAVTVLLAIAALTLACSGDEDEDAAAVATPGVTPTVSIVSTFTVPPTSTPGPPAAEAMKTFWLVDAASGGVKTLLQDYDTADYAGGFDASGDRVFVWSSEKDTQIEYSLAGNELSRSAPPEVSSLCESDGSLTLDGVEHPVLVCRDPSQSAPYPSPGEPVQHYIYRPSSPDARWYVYERLTDLPTQTPASGLSYDLWAVNLETGERRLLYESLFHCPGCDGDSETGWSPTGRYYVHVERGPQHRSILIDFDGQTVTDITAEGDLGFTGTVWSPVEDVLLHTTASGGIALSDLPNGTEFVLPDVPWWSEFDATGRYVISSGRGGRNQALKVADVSTAEVIATFEGEPARSDSHPAVATSRGFVAVLRWQTGVCEGVSIWVEAARAGCVEGAEWGTISPDGSKVALLRETPPSIDNPGRDTEYEVVLFDVTSGTQAVVAEGARGSDAPRMTWNATSTHLLVEWPVYRGL